MTEITHLLEVAAAGDRQAAAALLPLVYDELRQLAAARMAHERAGHSLDPTALVHEAYLRLIGDQHFDGKAHFFAAAAEAMRRVLVNQRTRHPWSADDNVSMQFAGEITRVRHLTRRFSIFRLGFVGRAASM
jgi:RNA polymerase sigma factor (TIGR02999 family)